MAESGWDCGQLEEALAGDLRLGDPWGPAVWVPVSPVHTLPLTCAQPQSQSQMPPSDRGGAVWHACHSQNHTLADGKTKPFLA